MVYRKAVERLSSESDGRPSDPGAGHILAGALRRQPDRQPHGVHQDGAVQGRREGGGVDLQGGQGHRVRRGGGRQGEGRERDKGRGARRHKAGHHAPRRAPRRVHEPRPLQARRAG
uniref:Uncharacterized protein n=1 Tax=Zea mays TaxID=4577 RepID=A0A804NY22_MAIZE